MSKVCALHNKNKFYFSQLVNYKFLVIESMLTVIIFVIWCFTFADKFNNNLQRLFISINRLYKSFSVDLKSSTR